MPHEIVEQPRPCQNKRARSTRQATQLVEKCADAAELDEAISMLQSGRESCEKSVLQSHARRSVEQRTAAQDRSAAPSHPWQ